VSYGRQDVKITGIGKKTIKITDVEMEQIDEQEWESALEKRKAQMELDLVFQGDEFVKWRELEMAQKKLKAGKLSLNDIAGALQKAWSKRNRYLQTRVLKDYYSKWKSLQEGGVVPGPTGQPMPVIAHGGESITPPGKKIVSTGANGNGNRINLKADLIIDGKQLNARLENVREEENYKHTGSSTGGGYGR